VVYVHMAFHLCHCQLNYVHCVRAQLSGDLWTLDIPTTEGAVTHPLPHWHLEHSSGHGKRLTPTPRTRHAAVLGSDNDMIVYGTAACLGLLRVMSFFQCFPRLKLTTMPCLPFVLCVMLSATP
jgi:hypothetical protein